MITRELAVELTETEKTAKGQSIARTLEHIDELEQEKKDRTRDLANIIKGERLVAKKLARQLREGKEIRPVECTEDLDFRIGVAHLKRNDTGEVIETRPLRVDERTPKLFDIKAKEPKAKKQQAAAPAGSETT